MGMDAQKFKNLIKEAVREVLREELMDLGKQKIQESIKPNKEAWDALKFTSDDVSLKLENKIGIGGKAKESQQFNGNPYADLLSQTQRELLSDPSEINNISRI